MNIQTDLDLTTAGLNRSEWHIVKRIVIEGTEDQRDQVLTWGWKNIPADMWEELVILAGRQHLLD